ncbi:class I SAM-dependent methyltransferase [Nitrolancea hollandica]|uniref:Methyltransferase type 11 n=1 Tax=Nitrolancea hollandica Lb TaxID=1129897 RepID=I4EJV8_9BACT|nr:class I SAM-dependent methyltransferase [Nitrolancea hollandica]CCF84970.1 Methyltransferase type 11 [Nitrolancea hollandica Lb]
MSAIGNGQRPDYGIDAPGVIRRLALTGLGGLAAGQTIFKVLRPSFPRLARVPQALGLLYGLWFLGSAGLMVWSSKVGKLRERERLLDAIPWRGEETVLDVGCGRGLLLTGAARRLTGGKAIGVDIWQEVDQSGNRPEATWANAWAEGVAGRVRVVDGDARRLPFGDQSFDAVVSHMVLHNIRDGEGRRQAVAEIARVLKPGGRLVIQDMRHTEEYCDVLRRAGMTEVERSSRRFGVFPPVRRVTGRKPGRVDGEA